MDVGQFDAFLAQPENQHVSFLFVDDGSQDATAQVLQGLAAGHGQRCDFLQLPKNSGKAEAIRQGMLHILAQPETFSYLAFMDADLATPLSGISSAIHAIDKYQEPTMLMGSRVMLYGTTLISRSAFRHYVGRIIASCISQVLKLQVYDTQCGFKFFKTDGVQALFDKPFISSWMFDVELIFRLMVIQGSRDLRGTLYEVPVERWVEKGDSKIPLSYVFKLPFELLKIRRTYLRILGEMG